MQNFTELKRGLQAFRTLFVKQYVDIKLIEQHRSFLYMVNNKPVEDITADEAFRVYNIIKPFADKLKWVDYDFNAIPRVTLDGTKLTSQNATNQEVTTTFPVKKFSNDKIIGYNGTDFVIRFAYNEQIYLSVKAIPGARYNVQNKFWNAPLTSADNIKAIVQQFGFDVGDEARRMMTNINENLEQSYSVDHIELNIDLKMKLYGYQTVGVKYMAENKFVINGDQMRLGKSPQSIGAVTMHNSFPCLTIAPKSLRLNWQKEWEMWTNKRVMILTHKNVGRLEYLLENKLIDVVIVNYDGVRTFFIDALKTIEVTQGERAGTSYKVAVPNGKDKLFKSVILDEAHNLRHTKNINYKCISQVFKAKELKYCLTGTPFVKGAQDLAALLELIGRVDEFGGRHKFIKQFKDMDKDFLSNKNSFHHAKAQQLRALNTKLRSLCFIRRERWQVPNTTPEKYRTMISVEIENRQDYEVAEFNLQEYLARNGASAEQINKSMQAEILVQYNTLKQLSSKGKISALKEHVENVILEGEKIIVCCWFNETVQEIKNQLKEYNPVTICGRIDGKDMKEDEIEKNKLLFNTSQDHNVIIITYGKGSEGHNLGAANHCAIIELGWTYKDQGQIEDRAIVVGKKEELLVTYFLGKDTIDEHIYDIIESRRKIEQEGTGGQEVVQTSFKQLTDIMMDKLKK
jgi:SWI/SNF-related matrix-associated actin-dependent regulator 1 of chromatin subfamily A